jgi:NhaP-type Na+/H+ or K+/H+ antiporter
MEMDKKALTILGGMLGGSGGVKELGGLHGAVIGVIGGMAVGYALGWVREWVDARADAKAYARGKAKAEMARAEQAKTMGEAP